MKIAITTILLCLALFLETVTAGALDFSLHKLESGNPGNTLLVIGGIQGDEPGGFNAASLLVTNYTIKKGAVWVVPNLNFISIIKRSRGVFGDLNRKFSSLPETDPEFEAIRKIKAIILDNQVDMILNLHDGSGFYHETYIDKMRNPNRWGQSIVIDQEHLPSGRFKNLNEQAGKAAAEVNEHLLADDHAIRVHNTKTASGDVEMAKTLTFFAARHNKAAFGLEASKSFPTHKRAYYHIRLLESFMNQLEISFHRDFTLTGNAVKTAIDTNVKLAIYDSKIFLDMKNARSRLNYIPLKKNADIEFTSSNPLIAVVDSGNSYRVFYGNRRVTKILPQYFDYDWSTATVSMTIDGTKQSVDFGRMVGVDNTFLVEPEKDYRANVIGFKKSGVINEAGIAIHRKDIQSQFSVDKAGTIFRVEIYRHEKFSGMVLVNFNGIDEKLNTARTVGALSALSSNSTL
jgi:hypothetical protein